jgi:hypothetical protein
MLLRRNVLLPALVLAAAVAASGTAARADMMTTCAAEIGRYCSTVSQGRGRISACLASYMGGLSAACRADVQAVGQSRLTPGWVRPVFNPAFRAPLPQACTADAGRFCPGMSPGEGRVFACLYAYSDRVSGTCSDAAQATLKAQ